MSRKLLLVKQCLLICIAFFFTINFYCQTTIKEKDYTLYYLDNNIELDFASPIHLKLYDAFSNEEITFDKSQNKANAFLLYNVTPGKIIKLEYSLIGMSNEFKSSYLASRSASTGAINVYFNHTVDTSVAQTQNAVNLSNTLDDMLISYINACASSLDIAIYNSYSPSATTGIAGAINAAYARGVQVRVIYDGSTGSTMIPLLNVAIPLLASPVSSSYGIMHNKFVIFDANSSDASKPFVWTGSTNWTLEQLDGPDKNSVITIQDQSLALGYTLEFNEMWGSNIMIPNATISKFGPYKTDNTPHTYVIGGKTVNSYFSPSDGANSKIINAVNSANSDINIATMLITRDDITNAIINKFNGGLTNINVVVSYQNPSGNDFGIIQSGILSNHAVIYNIGGLMHHKFMVIDNFNSASDPQVVVGSHNWSTSAEFKNDENTLIVHDANITNQYYQAFIQLYQEVGGVLSVPENGNSNDGLIVYPTITNDYIYLSNPENKTYNYFIYNSLGQVIKSNTTTNTIDMSNNAKGLYFVTLTNDNQTKTFKILLK